MYPYLSIFKNPSVLIEVIPLGGSIDNAGLTYFVSDELISNIQPGCLVEVPFRNALDYAIVTKVNTFYEETENLRSIVRVVTSIPFLSPYQIQTIFDCSSYYFVHAHHILSLFLSKSLVRYLEKKNFVGLNTTPSPPRRGLGWGGEEEDFISFHHHTGDTSFFSTIQKYINLPSPPGRGSPEGSGGEGINTVVVFPDDFFMDAYLKFDPSISEKACIIPEKLTETKKYKAFCSVYNGEKNIIIWTRRILYYNLSRYDRILYIEDSLHTKSMRFGHTYKHLEILRKLHLHGQFDTTILSSLPSIESMYLLHTGTYKQSND